MSVTLHLVLVPTITAFQHPYPEADRSPPKSYKTPEAINKWRAADQRKWTDERTDLCVASPRESRVVMAGMIDAYGTRTVLRAPTEGDEPALLRAVWAQLSKNGGLIATWNGTPQCLTLIARSALHGIAPDVSAGTIRDWFRPGSSAHADVKQWLSDDRYSKDSLSAWAEAFDLPQRPADLDAGAIWAHVQLGRLDDVETALVADLEALHAIAQRIEVFRAPTTWIAHNEAAAQAVVAGLRAASASSDETPSRVGPSPAFVMPLAITPVSEAPTPDAPVLSASPVHVAGAAVHADI